MAVVLCVSRGLPFLGFGHPMAMIVILIGLSTQMIMIRIYFWVLSGHTVSQPASGLCDFDPVVASQ